VITRIGIIGAGAIGSNGFVVAQGRQVGLATPFNAAIVRLFHVREIGFAPDPAAAVKRARRMPTSRPRCSRVPRSRRRP
jgi:hypothetical protein